MKNSSKGFVVPLLILIVLVLVIIGGVYIYQNKKIQTPSVSINTEIATTTNSQLSSDVASFTTSTTTLALPQGATQQVVCTYKLTQANDNEFPYSNGDDFLTDGKNCAIIIRSDQGDRIDVNGTLTKAYPDAYLSQAIFSPDGKHFAFVASNLTEQQFNALTGKPAGNFQRFIVVDGVESPVYDDIDNMEYSKDGRHFAYCAQKSPQVNDLVKVIDGVMTVSTNADCFNLFQDPANNINTQANAENSQNATSTDGIMTLTHQGPPSAMGADYQAYVFVKNLRTGTTNKYGPYWDTISYPQFSPDGKHFLYTAEVIDNEGTQNQQQYTGLFLDGKLVGKYNEIINPYFSADSKTVIYDARLNTTVFYVTFPVN